MSKNYTEKHSITLKGVLEIDAETNMVTVDVDEAEEKVDLIDALKKFANKSVAITVAQNEEV